MRHALRTRLEQGPAVLAVGAYDALSAVLIEQAGFEAIYVSGAAISYTQMGRPDMGFVSQDRLADVTERIRDRVSLPLIVDGDTGFGNALHVQRTIRLLERCGANAIQLEDQVFPKRCGHLTNKNIISAEEMAGKVRAAVDARHHADTLVIARTDALAIDGMDAALDRAALYVENGADIIFVEAPRSIADMKSITERLGSQTRLLANMVEGGVTPVLSSEELSKIGFDLVICPAGLVRAQTYQTVQFLQSLKAHGTTKPMAAQMYDFREFNNRIGLQELSTTGAHYDGNFHVAPEVN